MKKNIKTASILIVILMATSACQTTSTIDYGSGKTVAQAEQVEKEPSTLSKVGNTATAIVALPVFIIYTIFNPGWMNGQ
jgi:hypothetical protein